MLRKQFPQLRVALLERGHYARLKVGETLQPISWQILDQLGVWEAFQREGHVAAHGTRAAWGDRQPYDNEFLFHAQGSGWHLDRSRFDRFLAQAAAQAGCTVITGVQAVAQLAGEAGAWRVRTKTVDGEAEIEARFVIDASGRNANIAVAQGAKREQQDRLVSTSMLYEARNEDSTTLVEAVEDGWWYSARLPDQRLMVAFQGDERIAAQDWSEKLAQASFTLSRIKPQAEVELRVHPAFSQKLDCTYGPGWLAVGDAACTFDPLSSQGILKGLRSGVIAAYASGDWLCGKSEGLGRYDAMVSREYAGYLRTKRSYYAQEQRWPDHPFWRARQAPVLELSQV